MWPTVMHTPTFTVQPCSSISGVLPKHELIAWWHRRPSERILLCLNTWQRNGLRVIRTEWQTSCYGATSVRIGWVKSYGEDTVIYRYHWWSTILNLDVVMHDIYFSYFNQSMVTAMIFDIAQASHFTSFSPIMECRRSSSIKSWSLWRRRSLTKLSSMRVGTANLTSKSWDGVGDDLSSFKLLCFLAVIFNQVVLWFQNPGIEGENRRC